MRLTLVISSLNSGGAERIMSIMANYWVAKGCSVTLLSFSQLPPFYELDYRICLIPLGITGNSPHPIIGIWNNLQRICILHSAIYKSKPDAVISFMGTTNVLTLLATRGLKIPVIVSERNDPGRNPIGRFWKQLRQWAYPFADGIVVQTKEALNYFSSKLQARACIIPNPVLLPPYEKEPSNKLSGKRSLIAMGRFVQLKGFDLLLQAFAKLKDRYPEWTLTILGDGILRPELESLCHELAITERTFFLGTVKNSYEFLKQADIFVMSSRSEGFPNALCEAMASGLPVISTDCSNGPREIIRDGFDGVLVPSENISALATAMECLMSDEDERKRLATNALDITERFNLEKIMGMWEELLTQVVQNKA